MIEAYLDFVEGPLFYIAAVIFLLGVIWKLLGILFLGESRDLAQSRGSGFAGAFKTVFRHFIPRRYFWRDTSFHVIAGYAFHLGLFTLLLFAAPHVDFIKDRILGIAWMPLPHWAFILTAEIAFVGLLFLWLRRLMDPVQRLISDSGDHIATILTFIVMLTGCLALAQSHSVLRAVHMMFVDIWLIYFPFSRLMHTFTFLFSRSYTGSSYGHRGVEL